MSDKLEFFFHDDGGHAWLEVELNSLKVLGIANKISRYSYLRNGIAYLEEDCDAPIFINELKSRGQNFQIYDNYNPNTPIRNYPRYEL